MPLYEHVFIARQDLSEAQVKSIKETYKKHISSSGGKVTKDEYWGLRTLAYQIKKNKKGHYVLLNIDAPAPAVQEMERQLRINDDILRHLTVKVDELDNEPSAMMRRHNNEE